MRSSSSDTGTPISRSKRTDLDLGDCAAADGAPLGGAGGRVSTRLVLLQHKHPVVLDCVLVLAAGRVFENILIANTLTVARANAPPTAPVMMPIKEPLLETLLEVDDAPSVLDTPMAFDDDALDVLGVI